jgi:hypothetical protein
MTLPPMATVAAAKAASGAWAWRSHGAWIHLDAPYHILYGESLMKYNKVRLNDSTADG